MTAPHDYPKRILLAVSGLSPQVLTETLYALAVARPQPFVPTEVHLITTREGAHRARLTLLHRSDGHFHRLCRDYDLHGIVFDAERIHVVHGVNGEPLEDIRTPEDNEAAADFITGFVSRLTRDDDSALHGSIAGGRKTMGYYLGYALSLFGRDQDRLSHVLVSEYYEGHADFFYPTPAGYIIHTADALRTGMEAGFFMEKVSRINRLLNDAVGRRPFLRFSKTCLFAKDKPAYCQQFRGVAEYVC